MVFLSLRPDGYFIPMPRDTRNKMIHKHENGKSMKHYNTRTLHVHGINDKINDYAAYEHIKQGLKYSI